MTAFDRMMAWAAWACRPALVLFPLLVACEMAGLVATEVTIPFAVMAAIHGAGRKAWLASLAKRPDCRGAMFPLLDGRGVRAPL